MFSIRAMNNGNNILIRPFVVLSGAVTMAVTSLFMVGERAQYKKCLDMEHKTSVRLIRDTVDIDLSNGVSGDMSGGVYDIWSGTTRINSFRDTTGTLRGATACQNLNEVVRFCDYHEIRHARNDIYMRHVRNGGTPRLAAADELSGRFVELLARISGKPALPTGNVCVDINFNLADGVSLRDVCDLLLNCAVDDMQRVEDDYRNTYALRAKSLVYRLRSFGLLSEETVMNRLMTFCINGTEVNVLDAASDGIRNRVIGYINSYGVGR